MPVLFTTLAFAARFFVPYWERTAFHDPVNFHRTNGDERDSKRSGEGVPRTACVRGLAGYWFAAVAWAGAAAFLV
jgi:hypothetical protein